jgi:hypothetical protein
MPLGATVKGEVDDVLQPGPRGVPQILINRNLRMEGFQTADFLAEWDDALGILSRHRRTGSLHAAVHEWHGIECARRVDRRLARRQLRPGDRRLEPDPE